jgi:biotin carboxyl carrier protein
VLQNGSAVERAASAAILAAIRRFTQAQGRGHWRNNLSRPVLERFNLVSAFGYATEGDAVHMEVQLMPVTATRFEAVCVAGEAATSHVVELRGEPDDDLDVELNGRRISATVMATEADWWWVALDGEIVTLARQSPFPERRSGDFDSFGAAGRAARRSESATPGMVMAPLPGQVSAVFVVVGQVVRAHEPLLVIEAMKMEHVVRSSRDGEVAAIFVGQGDQARHGLPLLEITVHQAKEAGV